MPCIYTRALLLMGCLSFLWSFSAHATTSTIGANPFQTQPSKHLALLTKLSKVAPAANPRVIEMALSALDCATTQGMKPSRNLTVIDYSLPSTKPRLWVFDLVSTRLLFEELVAHGRNTGDNYARSFSNTYGSLQSSLGLFRTKETYDGSNGYSLRMDGLESGFNDKAMERAIVFHGAPYVTQQNADKNGRIGRSWGCPAVRMGIARKVIDTIKGDQFLFSYYPDKRWLTASRFLNCAGKQQLARK